jgi:hypothetical protein
MSVYQWLPATPEEADQAFKLEVRLDSYIDATVFDLRSEPRSYARTHEDIVRIFGSSIDSMAKGLVLAATALLELAQRRIDDER